MLAIVDGDKASHFSLFKLKQGHSQFTLYFCICQTLIALLRFIVSVQDSGIPMPLKIGLWCKNLISMIGWVYIYRSKKYVPASVLNAEGKRIMLLGDCIIIVNSLVTAVMFMVWALTFDDCESHVCEEDSPDGTMPTMGFLFAISGSISFPIFYPCHHGIANLLSIVIIYSSMLALGIVRHIEAGGLMGIVVVGIVIFFTFLILDGSILSNYSSYSQFESTLRLKLASENKEYLMKIQTEEMRHMLGA